MIDNIVGLASLPVGIVMFLNIFGIMEMQTLFGINIMIIAAIVVIVIQIANIIGAHIQDENVVLSWIVHILLMFPGFLYLLSMAISMPEGMVAALPAVMASFILMEGCYSIFF